MKKILSIERFPVLQEADISLRPCGAKDLSCLRRLFDDAAIPLSLKGGKGFRSLPSFAKWLILTFQVVYLIEVAGSVRGFIGLYGMKTGELLKLSISIFSPGDRCKGYGTRALGLLLPYLRRKEFAEEVYADVPKTNGGSLSFFVKAGFEVRGERDGVLLLARKL